MTNFAGICPVVEEYTHNCMENNQAKQYTKATEKLAEYTSIEYNMDPCIRSTIEDLTDCTIDKPNDPKDDATQVVMFMW